METGIRFYTSNTQQTLPPTPKDGSEHSQVINEFVSSPMGFIYLDSLMQRDRKANQPPLKPDFVL